MMRRALNIILAIGGLSLAASTVFAATINTNLPGTNPTVNNPGGFVANFYQFALLLGGLLAFGAIVYGGITYTLSAGNPEKQSDAKSRITQALLGLFLLLGAYIVLNLLNPKLTNLQLDTYGLTAACQGTGCDKPPPLDTNAMNAALDTYIADRTAQVRKEATNLDADADALRTEADATTDSKEKAALVQQALALEAKAERMRREDSVHDYAYRVAVAERNNDPKEIARLKTMLNTSLDEGIKELNLKGDHAGAETLALEKFTRNIYFDAEAAVATINKLEVGRSSMAQSDPARAQSLMSNAISDIGKRTRGEIQKVKDDPTKVAEAQQWGAAAIKKIRDECDAQKLKC